MKSRFGFVSNSSSTSFVLLVKPEKAEAIEFILRHAKAWDDSPCKTVPERRKDLKAEIREVDKDVKYVDNLLTKVDNVTKEGLEIHQLLDLIDSFSFGKRAIRDLRMYPRYRKNLKDYTDTLVRFREDLKEDRAEMDKQIEALDGNDEWNIITFEEDLNFGTLKYMVDELVEKGEAVIVKKVVT